jgi:SCY1-like protein 1
MMNEEEFKSIFIPKILDLFENNDRTVRVNLLKNLGTIMPHLSQQHVEEKIYPNVAKGFKDGAPVVREMTVKSMIDIAPRLKQETVNDDLIRNLWNLQADKESSIRTNTVIAIGKLANLLDDKTRKKVLLPAFARSLRDPFLHSRLSALRALLSTKEYYNVREVATKLLPVVTPLMIDNEKGVRDLAVQCTNTFLTQVTTMASAHNFDQLMAQEDGVPYTGHVGSTDSSKPPPPSPTQGDNASYYNWAVSGVTNSVSAIKKATIGDTPPPPPRSESHAPTSGYGAEPNYAPPKKQLQNPDLFQDMNVKDQPKKKPSNSLVLEHKKPTPSQSGWDDAGDVFGSNDNSYVNNFNDDAFGSDWNIEPVTKSVTAIKSSEKKPKPKAKSNNPFDDDSIDTFGSGGGWDMGGGLSPMQPKTAPQSQPLQPKRAPQSQPMQQPMQPKQNQLRTEHRPTPQGFSMQNNNNDILQPKKAPPKKKPSKDEIDWDAF